jgi:hypothetical protein
VAAFRANTPCSFDSQYIHTPVITQLNLLQSVFCAISLSLHPFCVVRPHDLSILGVTIATFSSDPLPSILSVHRSQSDSRLEIGCNNISRLFYRLSFAQTAVMRVLEAATTQADRPSPGMIHAKCSTHQRWQKAIACAYRLQPSAYLIARYLETPVNRYLGVFKQYCRAERIFSIPTSERSDGSWSA